MLPRACRYGLLLLLLATAGCRGDDHRADPLVPLCTAQGMAASLREVRVDADHEATARLTLMNTGAHACRSQGAPTVVIDSGLGPSPAVDGTAAVAEGYGPDEVIEPGAALVMPLSWGTAGACDGNHQLPVVRVLVTLPQEHVALVIPASGIPRLARTFCWVDGLALG